MTSTYPASPAAHDYDATFDNNNLKNNKGVNGNANGCIINSGTSTHVYAPMFTQPSTAPVDELEDLWREHVANDASCDSLSREYHDDTRPKVLGEIKRWLRGEGTARSPILWLRGPAGVGKSVIAREVCNFQNEGFKIVGTFFFSTSSDKTGAKLFPTLAWQLAKHVPETTQKRIINAMRENRSVLTGQIQPPFESQFKLLIDEPLRLCKEQSTSVPVMIIDGVDECIDDDNLKGFLSILGKFAETKTTPLRFLICSRPERRIHAQLEKKQIMDRKPRAAYTVHPTSPSPQADPSSSVDSSSHSNQKQSFSQRFLDLRTRIMSYRPRYPKAWKLQRVVAFSKETYRLYHPLRLGGASKLLFSGDTGERDMIHIDIAISYIEIGLSNESTEGIKKYLKDRLTQICPIGVDVHVWLKPEKLEELVERSSGQFLYATVIIRLLENRGFTVDEVCEMASVSSPRLNELYAAILQKQEQKDFEFVWSVLAILVVFSENAHLANGNQNMPTIAALLGVSTTAVASRLQKMLSTLNINEKNVSVYHRSFLEFLQDQSGPEKDGDQVRTVKAEGVSEGDSLSIKSPQRKLFYLPYPIALRIFLRLSMSSIFRISLKALFRMLDNDDDNIEILRDLIYGFPRKFFRDSRNPTVLASLHATAHTFPILFTGVPICLEMRRAWIPFIHSLAPSPISAFAVRFALNVTILFLIVCCQFLMSLHCYLRFRHYTYVMPLFHPLLHPYFVKLVDLASTLRKRHTTIFFILLAAFVTPFLK